MTVLHRQNTGSEPLQIERTSESSASGSCIGNGVRDRQVHPLICHSKRVFKNRFLCAGGSATSAWSVGASALAAAGGPAEAGSSTQRDVASAPDVVWCGTTRATVPSLQGGSEAEVPLQVGFAGSPKINSGIDPDTRCCKHELLLDQGSSGVVSATAKPLDGCHTSVCVQQVHAACGGGRQSDSLSDVRSWTSRWAAPLQTVGSGRSLFLLQLVVRPPEQC